MSSSAQRDGQASPLPTLAQPQPEEQSWPCLQGGPPSPGSRWAATESCEEPAGGERAGGLGDAYTCSPMCVHSTRAHVQTHSPSYPQDYNQDPQFPNTEGSRWGSRLAFLGEGNSFSQVPTTAALPLGPNDQGITCRGGGAEHQKLPSAVNRQSLGCVGASKFLGPSHLSAGA